MDGVKKYSGCTVIAAFGLGLRWLWQNYRRSTLVAAAAIGFIQIRKVIKKKQLRHKWDTAGENVVVVHAFMPAKATPNLSPFVLKLETYLRMADIKYEIDREVPFGPKGKVPWITINGEDIADSQLIIERLSGRFHKRLNSNLTEEQKAIERAILIMNDEHLFWGLESWLVFSSMKISDILECGRWMDLMAPLFRRKISRHLWSQGIGRHSPAEIQAIMEKDMEALSVYLGTKPYLMGQEPSEVDAAVFGLLAVFYWNCSGSYFQSLMEEKYTNLRDYVLRIKARYWPDWNQRLKPPRT